MNVTNLEIAKDYCYKCINNIIPACLYIKQACLLFLNNLEREDLIFDEWEVDKIVRFINCLDLSEQSTPTKFILQPWQTFLVCGIYGFYYKESGLRKVNTVFLELPRKNGKSQLIIALAVYHLLFENEAQVIVSANSREQAKLVDFKKSKQYCTQLDKEKKHLKQRYNSINFGNNELIVTASDAKRLDGLNASLVVIDELHEAKNADMYNVLKSSQGSRKNPLLIAITTAGFDSESFCYSLVEYSQKVLAGDIIDDSQFNLLYTLDDGDDYTDYNNIAKANPNIDVSVSKQFIIDEIKKGLQNPIESFNTKVKYFNIWLTAKNYDEQYIDMNFIECTLNKSIKMNDEMFKNADGVYIGVDLAAISDIAAVSYMFWLDGKYYFFNRYYLPKNNQNSLLMNKKYIEWTKQGYIKMIEGNVIDYDDIITDIIEVAKEYTINLISYDNWNSNQFAISGTKEGFYMLPYSQSTQSINRPAKELSRLIMSNNVIIEYNPVTKWMFSNTLVKEYGENIRLDKRNKNNKIDGVVAMVTCLGGYLASPSYNFNVY